MRHLLMAAVCGLGCTQQAAAPEPTVAPSGAAARLKVTEVAMGDGVGLDKRVLQATDVFDPEDTIHVSVVTEGTSSSTLLAARWLRGGKVLQETKQSIAPQGSATSEFHVSRPGGFEPGDYEVEILIEGTSVHRRRFTVQAAGGR